MTTKVDVWETIDHRWIVRDAVTRQIPKGETYRGHATKLLAIRSAQRHGWAYQVSPAG